MHNEPNRVAYNPVILFLISALFVSGFVIGHFKGPIVGALAVLGVMIAIMLIGSPKKLLLGCLLWGLIQRPITGFVYGDEVLVLLLMLVLFFENTYLHERLESFRPIKKYIMFLLGIFCVSAAINHPPAKNVLMFTLGYLSFIPFFYLSLRHLNEDYAPMAVKLTFWIFLFQLALNIGWAFGVNPLPNHSLGSDDFAQGSLRGCNLVAYFNIFYILILASLFKNKGFRARRGVVGFGLAVGMAAQYIAFTTHSYLLLLVGLGVQTVIGGKSASKIFGSVVAAALAIILIAYIDSTFSGSMEQSKLTQEGLLNRWEAMWGGPVGQIYEKTFFGGDQAHRMLIGYGPGNALSGVGVSAVTPKAYEYLADIWLTFSGAQQLRGGSITQSTMNGLVTFYSEFGIFGVLAIVGIYVCMLGRIWRNYQKKLYQNMYAETLAEAFIPWVIIFLLLCLTGDYFQEDFFLYGIWIIAAILWDPKTTAPAGLEKTKVQSTAVQSGKFRRRGF
jgi:hypothetical protein